MARSKPDEDLRSLLAVSMVHKAQGSARGILSCRKVADTRTVQKTAARARVTRFEARL